MRSYIECFYADESRDHMVFPGMVYISHPTEYGTLYSIDELKALRKVQAEEVKTKLTQAAETMLGNFSRQIGG